MKIRLTVEEKAKLKHDATLCGVTQSEYLRQICLGKRPAPKQPPEFWELLDALYEIHDKLERLTAYCPEAAEECSRRKARPAFAGGGVMATTSLWHIKGTAQ